MSDVVARLSAALADRYRIERELGQGGMATVYLVEDLKHRRKVALKVLRPELAQSLGPERFLREIEIAAGLHHPHILPLYDSGRTGGSTGGRGDGAHGQPSAADDLLFYVMPYVEGESLRHRLDREKQLPLDDALQIAREAADALSYAHSRGLIHRDIKPENILLEHGHAVVADFGIARAISAAGDQALTETGVAIGTPQYMSPEQAAGERDLDGRSDLYSLACVLYEMLAGQPPFTGPTVGSVVHQHLAAEPRAITQLRPAVPAEVAGVLQRALAKNPADRFNPVAQFSDALRAGATATGGGVTVPAPVARAPRRTVLTAVAGIAGALAIVAGGVAGWRALAPRTVSSEDARRVAVLPFENQTGDATLDPIGRMAAEWITEGLAQTSEIQVVPTLLVLQTLGGIRGAEATGEQAPSMQELARLTRAGIVVAGSYYRRSSSLELHSEVLDVASGKPLAIVEPVSGAVDDPTPAIDTVRLRVMGVLAARLTPVGWEIPASVRPPSYAAYRAYVEGQDRWIANDFLASAAAFERAYALDTTYLRGLVSAASAYGNAGRRAAADSLRRFVEARRDRLSPYDQYRLDWMVSRERGDREAELRAARAAVRLVPIGTARFALMLTLVTVNRPREALGELDDVLQHGMPEPGYSWSAVWGLHTELYHLLGQHERELDVAREGRARLPSSAPLLWYEARALAALGRVTELRTLTVDLLANLSDQTIGVLESLGEELRAHGYRQEANDVVDRALAWSEAHPPAVDATPAHRRAVAELLYLRDRWAESAAQWDSIPPDSTRQVDDLGRRGALAARLGLADSARAISRRLAGLTSAGLVGRHALWRARIAAVLGDRADAMTLLRQAFAEGLGYGLWIHTDTDLEPLREYPPFRELARPKG